MATKTASTAELRPRTSSTIPEWLPLVLMSLFLVAVARQGARAISDPDTFWHLRLGEDILDARSVSAVTEPWSELSSQPWVPTQWLTEVVLAAAANLAGLAGVAWLFTVGLLGLVLGIYGVARRVADTVPAAFATGLTIGAMAASLSPRPHMVTYLFLVLTLSAWLRTCDDLRPRWWLVAATWIWAMCHGMWFLGPLVGLAVIGALALDGRVNRTQLLRLATIPAASTVAAALTSVGPSLLGAPFAVAGVGAFITEWQPPSFRSPSPAAAALMVAVVVVVWSRSTRRVPWPQIALLALGTGWILLSTRTVAIGALLVAPVLAAALQEVLRREAAPVTRREGRTLALVAASVACVVAVVAPHTASAPANVPSRLDPALDALGPGVVLNSYELGGWLRWAHPDLEPVVDGMTEAYSVDYLTDYGRATAVASGWDEVVRGWSPDAALLPSRSPLSTALVERMGWVEVDSAGGYTLLAPGQGRE